MTIKQYINLPKKEIFKDSDIDSIDRCGDITIEVEVDKADKAISYKAKVTPVESKDIYNKDELIRNKKFRLRKGVAGIVDSKKILVEGIGLPAAGGYKYKVEVQDAAGNTVSTPVEVETCRKLYYQKISMETGSNTVPSYSMSFLEDDSLQHHITIENKGSEVKIPYMKTVMMQDNGHNLTPFGTSISNAFNIDNELKKMGMAVVYTEYLADKGSDVFSGAIVLGANGGSINAQFTRTHLIVEGNSFLWHGLDDTEDANKEFFDGGEVKYRDASNSANNLTYLINKSDVDVNGTAWFSHGGYFKIQIAILPGTTLETMSTKAIGTVEVEVDVMIADGWTNGFSWPYNNTTKIITCARKVEWEDMPSNTREYTWVHEIGHRFGMTPWGNATYGDATRRKKLPDAPSKMYYDADGKNYGGHRGPHCGKGAAYDEANDSWSGTPECVMFGANGIGNNHAPSSYCDECKPLVRKLDLSE